MKQHVNLSLQWIHGFTQKRALETDAERVRQIINENESKVLTKDTVEKAISMENRIASNDPLKPFKMVLINAVFKIITTPSSIKQAEAEQEIRTTLSRYPKLASFVAHLRNELKNTI